MTSGPTALQVVPPIPPPDPEVSERAARRRFTAEYKLRMLRHADACTGTGALGALLRRERLYSSHLTTWRRQREEGSLAALSPKKRGCSAVPPSPLAGPRCGTGTREHPVDPAAAASGEHHRLPKKTLRGVGDCAAVERRELLSAVGELASTVSTQAACRALGVSRATVYRRRRLGPPRAPRPRPLRALAEPERHAILAALHHPRFIDLAPAEIYATLPDEGRYLGSLRTMYRVLAASQEVRERRNQLRHVSPKPELLATRPNEMWSWDITKLLGPAKWTYYYLYGILDIFSRYAVGWMLAHQESAALAERLIAATCAKQAILPTQLTIHADRGSSMTARWQLDQLREGDTVRVIETLPHRSNRTTWRRHSRSRGMR